MLTNLIENRGKDFSSLLKIGDYLGRSLRENVELFSVENGKATYITESGKVIGGSYSFKPLSLTNIQIDDASVLENKEIFDSITDKKVSVMLANLLENDYSEAENSFDSILDLFETKLSYDRIKLRLEEKVERFGEQTKIVSCPEFTRVKELKDQIVKFLKESEKLVNIPEINNGLKLASVVSNSFNLPKITIEQLKENRKFVVKNQQKGSIYEHLCKQELIAKELLEAKENFDTTWANNDLISDLASMVYETKVSKIENKIAETISQIPYFALATKKQIHNLIENCLSVIDLKDTVSSKDLTKFVSVIFEMKKPVKDYIINLLNEKYGININNLTDIPTFSNLIKTEAVILTAIAKLAPKNSIIKKSLLEFVEVLKIKNGSESIDVVDFINELFTESGYKKNINETSLLQYLDFSQVAEDLGKIGSILKLLKPVLGGGNAGGDAPQMGGMDKQMPMGKPAPEKPLADALPDLGAEEGLDGLSDSPEEEEDIPLDHAEDSAEEANLEGAIEDGEVEEAPKDHMEPDGDENGEMDDMEGGNNPMELPGEETEEPVNHVDGDDITNLVASIEDLLHSIKAEIGGEVDTQEGDGESEFEDNYDFEGGDAQPMEGEEEIPDEELETGEEPDDDIPQEEDEEVEEPPKKKLPFKK